jgi:hypothetical protein
MELCVNDRLEAEKVFETHFSHILKKVLTSVTCRYVKGWLTRSQDFFGGQYLEFHTYNSHGNCFYVYLKSICTFFFVKNCNWDYLDLQKDLRAKWVLFAHLEFPCNHLRHFWVFGSLQTLTIFFAFFFLLIKKVQLFKVQVQKPFRAPSSEEKISRSTHTIHTGIDSTCAWCPYVPCCTSEALIQIILTSIRTAIKHDLCSLDFLGLVKEIENKSSQVTNHE